MKRRLVLWKEGISHWLWSVYSRKTGYLIYRLLYVYLITLNNMLQAFWVSASPFRKYPPPQGLCSYAEHGRELCYLSVSRWQLPNHFSLTMLRHETSLGKVWFQSRRKQLWALNWAFLSPAQRFRTCNCNILSNQHAVEHLPIIRKKYTNHTAVKSEKAFLM